MEDVYEHIVVSPEAKRRIKLFSVKYGIPMKIVVEWLIFSLLDENGEPQTDILANAIQEIRNEKRKSKK